MLAGLLYSPCFAQTTSIKMISDPNPWGSKPLNDLAQWQDIEYHKVKFTSKDLKGKNYYIVAKDIWGGHIEKIDTLYRSGSNMFFEPVQGDTLAFSVMGGKTSERSLRIELIFERFSVSTEYLCTNSKDYSLRDYGRLVPIETGRPFYAFAYILPYNKGNEKFYCAVEGSGKDIERWGQEFGIEHYIIFEMKFY